MPTESRPEPQPTDVLQYRQILLWPLHIVDAAGQSLSPQQRIARWADTIQAPQSPWARTDASAALVMHVPEEQGHADRYADNRERFAEFVYFHPFVQRLLYCDDHAARNPDSRPLHARFRRTDFTWFRARSAPGGPNWDFQIDRLELWLFDSSVLFFVIELAKEVPADSKVEPAPWPLEAVLALQDQIRRVYPPFTGCDSKTGQCRCPVVLDGFEFHNQRPATGRPAGDQVAADKASLVFQQPHTAEAFDQEFARPTVTALRSPIITAYRELLQPLCFEDDPKPLTDAPRLRQIGDDRMFTMTFVAVRDARAVHEHDMMRLTFCDARDNSGKPGVPPYSPAFVSDADFAKRFAYDRFWERAESSAAEEVPQYSRTTRFMMCEYSLIAIGNHSAWFFANLVREHFRRHYFGLTLLLLLQKTALLRFMDRAASEAARIRNERGADLSDAARKRLERLQREYVSFLAGQTFPEISGQVQGREIFDLLRGHLRIGRLQEKLTAELDLLNQIAAEDGRQRGEDLITRLTVVSVFGVPLLALVALPPFAKELCHAWEQWRNDEVVVLSILIAAVLGVIAFVATVVRASHWLGKVLDRFSGRR